MKRLLVCFLVLMVAAPAAVYGQSLAELAKKEEARRKTLKPARKIYTNGDLGSEASRPPAPAPAPATGGTAPEPSAQVPSVVLPGGKAEPLEPAKDQAYWSGRMTAARAALERSRIFGEALQSRINALSADFVNRDDPAQRAQIELERQRTVAELDRVKREITEQAKAIVDIENEARKAGVPPGWLR